MAMLLFADRKRKGKARHGEMTDDRSTMLSSTSLTTEPSSKLRHPSALLLAGAFCFLFSLFGLTC